MCVTLSFSLFMLKRCKMHGNLKHTNHFFSRTLEYLTCEGSSRRSLCGSRLPLPACQALPPPDPSGSQTAAPVQCTAFYKHTNTHMHWHMKWSNNSSHVMDVTYKCDVVMVLALRDWVTWQAFVRRDSRNSSRARAQLTVKERADMRRPNDNQTTQISALLRKIMF